MCIASKPDAFGRCLKLAEPLLGVHAALGRSVIQDGVQVLHRAMPATAPKDPSFFIFGMAPKFGA